MDETSLNISEKKPKSKLFLILILFLCAAIGLFVYWYFFMGGVTYNTVIVKEYQDGIPIINLNVVVTNSSHKNVTASIDVTCVDSGDRYTNEFYIGVVPSRQYVEKSFLIDLYTEWSPEEPSWGEFWERYGNSEKAVPAYMTASDSYKQRLQELLTRIENLSDDSFSVTLNYDGQAAMRDGSVINDSSTSTVYWTENGKCYHSNSGCFSLRNSKSISSGSVEKAKAAGKSDPCAICVK